MGKYMYIISSYTCLYFSHTHTHTYIYNFLEDQLWKFYEKRYFYLASTAIKMSTSFNQLLYRKLGVYNSCQIFYHKSDVKMTINIEFHCIYIIHTIIFHTHNISKSNGTSMSIIAKYNFLNHRQILWYQQNL